MAASQATASPAQRPCHMPRSASATCCGTNVIMTPRSEPALRNDHDVAGPHLDVGRDIAASNEILESHAVLAPTLRGAKYRRVVAVGEVRKTPDCDHHIEQRHPLPVWERLRTRRLPHDPDLFAVRAVELGDKHGYHGIADEFGHRFLDVTRELRRS